MPPAPAPKPPAEQPASPEQDAGNSLPAAAVLAGVGGFLDAFLYLDHGHVFAGAMTGNTVLFGLSLLAGNPLEILHHALPLVAFFGGVWLAEVLEHRTHRHTVALGLGCEAAGLLVASCLPSGFPDQPVVFLVCLIAAFQIGCFRKAGQYSFNSTFITGDLRTTITGLYDATLPGKRASGLRQFRELALLLGCFLAGALAGGFGARRLGNHALWAPCAALVMVLGVALRAARKRAPIAGPGSATS